MAGGQSAVIGSVQTSTALLVRLPASEITRGELVDVDGLQLHGCADRLTLLGFLLWQYPGEIEPPWPKCGPRRERPPDGGLWSGLGNWQEWPP